jgi:hypothetical protein
MGSVALSLCLALVCSPGLCHVHQKCFVFQVRIRVQIFVNQKCIENGTIYKPQGNFLCPLYCFPRKRITGQLYQLPSWTYYHYTSHKACQIAHRRTNKKFLVLQEIAWSSTTFVLDPCFTTNLLPGTYSLKMNKGIFLYSEIGKQRGHVTDYVSKHSGGLLRTSYASAWRQSKV